MLQIDYYGDDRRYHLRHQAGHRQSIVAREEVAYDKRVIQLIQHIEYVVHIIFRQRFEALQGQSQVLNNQLECCKRSLK